MKIACCYYASPHLHPVRRRAGATIIEVMFSIGVLLFGLLGIAAFIPAASKLARNSIDLNRGASIGQSVSREFNARGFGNSRRWITISDVDAAPATMVVGSALSPVAIDNLFVSRPENVVLAGNTVGISTGQYNQFTGANTNNYFRRNQFPYYHSTYNPLIDPRLSVTNAPWPVMPRLQRVAINSGTGIPRVLSSNLVADDNDQLAFDTPDDKSLPVSQVIRSGSGAPSNNDFPLPGTRSGRPEYSWFATIQPWSATMGTLSVAVIRGRDRTFETPVDGTSIDPTELLEVSERLAWVSSAVSDFRGGAGGTVTLSWSSGVSGKLSSDGWVMLIKNVGGLSRHAWYRIVTADREPFLGTVNDPAYTSENRTVWQANVTLEGPDWTFTNAGVATQTLAVLIDGVVSVTESTVRLQ